MTVRRRLLAKVAHLYYVEDRSQQEIAGLLGYSRSMVSRLLTEARASGVVRVEITGLEAHLYRLERDMAKRYGLRQVVVVPVVGDTEDEVVRQLGKAGAAFLWENLRRGMIIGISWGRTLEAVARQLKVQPRDLVDRLSAGAGPAAAGPHRLPVGAPAAVVPLVGGAGQIDPQLHANEICRRAAQALGGPAKMLYAPAVVSNEATRDALYADPSIQEVFDLARRADIALVGIGGAEGSVTWLARAGLRQEVGQTLAGLGVVGDVNSWFFDSRGRFIDTPLAHRTVALSPADLGRAGELVAVAGHPKKVAAIRAALEGRLVTGLITDERVARILLDEAVGEAEGE